MGYRCWCIVEIEVEKHFYSYVYTICVEMKICSLCRHHIINKQKNGAGVGTKIDGVEPPGLPGTDPERT